MSVVAIGIWIAGPQFEGPAVTSGGCLQIAGLLKINAEAVMRFGKIVVQFERAAIGSKCGGVIAQFLEGVAEVVVSQGKIGVQREGLLVVSDGFIELAIVLGSQTKIAVSFGIIRLKRDCLAVAGDGLITAAQLLEDVAQVEASLGIMGPQRKRSRDATICGFEVVCLMRELAEKVPGLDVVRVGAEDIAVGGFRSLQTAGPMMIDGSRKNFADRGHVVIIPALIALFYSTKPKLG